MLMPKRVKHRKQFRGRMTGKALRGNKITNGDFGIVAMEPAWIKSNQIEAARTAMGFYQVNPSDGVFAFGSPRFKKIEVKVRGGKVFTVEAPNNSKDNIYIQKVYLNGKPYHKSYITYDDIINGSTLKFEMGKKPAKNFGKASANRPIVLNK